MKKSKPTLSIIIALAVVLLSGIGIVGALNGFFGGGGNIPSDTFTRGLVGYWGFEEGSGKYAYDGSGNSNTGTLGGYASATSSDPKWAAGKVGGALSFDGKDDYVSIGVLGSTSGGISIEAWVYPKIIGANQTIYMNNRDVGTVLQILNDNTIYLRIESSPVEPGNWIFVQTTSAVITTANNWYHITGIYDRTSQTMKIYLNGVSQAVTVTSMKDRDVLLSRPGYFGTNYNVSGNYFNGTIDEVRIYNRALTAAEVKYHYNRGGPVGYWKFDEGTGQTAFDSSGNNNTGTLYGGIATSTADGSGWKAGKYGSALAFDGVDDYVGIGDKRVFDFGTGDFFVEAWFKALASGGVIVNKGYGGSSANTWYLQISGANVMTMIFLNDAGASGGFLIGTTNIVDGQWHHVAGGRSGNQGFLYLDGKIEKTGANSQASMTNSASVEIGVLRSDPLANAFNGLIDDVRIYNYARTPDEIALDYNAGFAARFGHTNASCDKDPGSCIDKGLVGYWNMDEGSGTTTVDMSGNNNTGVFATTASSPKWTTGIKPFSGGASGGGALQFDGVNDYVNTGKPLSTFISATTGTICLWIKPSGAAVSGGQYWVIPNIIEDGDNNYMGIYRGIYGGNDRIWIANYPESIGVTYTVDTWIHICWMHSSGTLYAFKNGALFSSTASGNTPSLTGILMIGSRGGTSQFFNGLIDEVRIYNRALTAEEIRYHYNRGGPVAQWKLDEGSGSTAYDSTDNNNDGTLYGGMATSTATASGWKQGKYGSALAFDGVNDYVRIVNSGSLDVNYLTIGAWIKPSSVTGPGVIVDKDYTRYRLYIQNGNLKSQIASGNVLTATQNTLSANTWYYVALTYDKQNQKLWINGSEVASQAETGTIPASPILAIGSFFAGSTWFFNGLIDDVRIYNYVRTQDQILQDYNEGFAAYFGPSSQTCDIDPGSCLDKGLVGYWNMDEWTGITTVDQSGNNNTGTLTNGPKWTTGIKPFSGGISGGGVLQFDGKDDYVDAGSGASLNITDATFEAWVYARAFTNSLPGPPYYPKIICKYGSYWFLLASSGNTAIFSASNACDDTTVLYTNTWYHLVASISGTSVSYYVNGVPTKNYTSGCTSLPYPPTSGNLTIGGDQDGNALNGLIDEVRIYNRALSAAEIRYHYNRGGPVGYWKLDEGSGSTAYDNSNNSNDGTLYGGMATSTSASSGWKQGQYGSALAFDGMNDYVSVPYTANLEPTKITLEAWVKTSMIGYGDIFSHITSGYYSYYLTVGYPTAGIIRLGTDVGSGDRTLDSVTVINDGAWHHIVATFDGNVRNIFIDGKLDKTNSIVTGTLTYSGSNPLRVGWRTDVNWWFNGLIDDVRIYNYARTQDQILQDYNGGLNTHFK